MNVLRTAGRRIPLSTTWSAGKLWTPRPCSISTTAMRPVDQNPSSKSKKPLQEIAQEAQSDEQHLRDLASETVYGKAPNVELYPGMAQVTEDILNRAEEFHMAEPHHLHIFAHKHNTHITLTTPQRNCIISKSAGNIGFRKAARGSYDAAYQLAAFVLGHVYENGTIAKIQKLEIILRGFGIGREAVTKVLMGVEGRRIREKIVRVSDGTRLKFGGARSPKPRRLG